MKKGILIVLLLLEVVCYGQLSDYQKAIEHAKSGEYEKATHFFLEEYADAYEVQDTSRIVQACRMLGNVFSFLQDTINRKKYYLMATDLSRESNDEYQLFYSLVSLSYMYASDYEQEAAIEASEEAIHLIENTKDTTLRSDTSGIGAVYLNTGAAYGRVGDNRKALENYLIAAKYLEKFKEPRVETIKLYGNIASCYRHENKKDKSRKYYERSLDVALELGSQREIQFAVNGLYEWHKKFGDPEIALHYLEKSLQLKDSILNMSVITSIEELHTRYQSDQLKSQITELNNTNLKNTEKIQSIRAWIFWLVVILLVIGGFSAAYILRQRFILRTQQLEFEKNRAELKQRVLTAQMNPHFLFNSLNSIQRMYVEGNLDEANNYMANFGSLLRKVLTYSNLEKVELSKDIELLKIYLELERKRVDTDFQFHLHLDPELDATFVKVPPLLVQPFVENAIWHGIAPLKESGQIDVYFSLEEDYLQCEVIDNGVGYDNSLKNKKTDHVSKGVSIVRERLAKLSEPIVIRQTGERGTSVTLKIPIT